MVGFPFAPHPCIQHNRIKVYYLTHGLAERYQSRHSKLIHIGGLSAYILASLLKGQHFISVHINCFELLLVGQWPLSVNSSKMDGREIKKKHRKEGDRVRQIANNQDSKGFESKRNLGDCQ
jgi:hypothetical protein